MAAAAYYRWVDAGRPYRDSRPTAKVAANIRRHGYTVYTAGDTSHQQADPPQDHVAFSATGWPAASAFGVGHAFDVMPPTAAMVARGLPTLAQLGAQIYADRRAGVPGASWLKYMNWEPDGPTGRCVQDSWQPAYRRSNSGDRGHIHASGRSDMDDSTVADDYDPVQRWLDKTEDDMQATDQLDVPDWLKKTYPTDKGLADGKISVGTALASGYAHARVARDAVEKVGAKLDALTAAFQALAAGGTSVDTTAVIAAVDKVGDELGGELAQLRAERDELAARLAAALDPAA